MDMNVALELEMRIACRGLRLLLLHELCLGPKATEAASNICGMMGKDALAVRTAQHYFHRFKKLELRTR